nr:Chain C, GLU-PRO-GLN-SER-ALA-PRO-HIS-GLY-VAL [Severe acute respiratory syndrome coronavirus 2]
EPQSAPHGV